MPNEYGEPWERDESGWMFMDEYKRSESEIDSRILRCVNALAGVPDEVVEKGLDAVFAWYMEQRDGKIVLDTDM